MRQYPVKLLDLLLGPAACIAWWITRFRPNLLERQSLHVVIAGAESLEASDQGRWLSFLAWLCGQPDLSIRVTLVGEHLMPSGEGSMVDMPAGLIASEVTAPMWQTPLASAVRVRPPAQMFNGSLHQWLASGCDDADAYVFFAPVFELYRSRWIAEDDIVPVLRRKVPTAIFPRSRTDASIDLRLLELYGVKWVHSEVCPWRVCDDDTDDAMFAHSCIDVPVEHLPSQVRVDRRRVEEFHRALGYLAPDLSPSAATRAEDLGQEREAADFDDFVGCRIIMLPRNQAVLERTGEAGFLWHGAFSRFQPSVTVPRDVMQRRPTRSRSPEAVVWAVEVHQRYVAPLRD